MSTVERARQQFLEEYENIRQIIDFVSRRHRLDHQESSELGSYVMWKLVEKNFARLRHFRGSSSLGTYLTTVIQRLFLDYRAERWGKWRPSAKARRLGETAVALERLMCRDGYDFATAAQFLQSRESRCKSREELWELAEALPCRKRRYFVELQELDGVSAEQSTTPLEVQERQRLVARIENLLADQIHRLSEEERLILKLRFADEFSVQRIASTLRLKSKSLYTRIQRLLSKIRDGLDGDGVRRENMVDLLEWKGLEMDFTHVFGKRESSFDVRL